MRRAEPLVCQLEALSEHIDDAFRPFDAEEVKALAQAIARLQQVIRKRQHFIQYRQPVHENPRGMA